MKEIPIKSMIGISDKFLIKKYPEFYKEIFKIENDVTLSERIWLYKNELESILNLYTKR